MNEVYPFSPQERMIRQQIMDRGIDDSRVIEAMRAIPRERFFPAEGRELAYADRAAPIGHGQSISQPYIVALMTARLDLQPTHRVLEIGTGSGYQTAILSKLSGDVFTVERIKPLLDIAWERMMSMGLRNIHFRYGDGALGWPEAAPFDRLLIAAGMRRLPRQLLLAQLADGGQAVMPVGDTQEQTLMHIRRDGEELITTHLCACRFVDFVGEVQ